MRFPRINQIKHEARSMKNSRSILVWIARAVAALIMLQTLYFKFTGAAESIEIFSTLGMEPWGRYAAGFIELVASVLLIISSTAWLGAILGAGSMAGAIFFHLTKLGIEVRGDGGYLFGLAVTVLVCCLFILVMEKEKLRSVVGLRG